MIKLKKETSAHKKPALLTDESPFLYSEAYKTLRTNLQFISANDNVKKIVITSSTPGEGKSITSLNLAKILSENGAKVILIDCDMRKPSNHKYMKVHNSSSSGLSALITGKITLADCINKNPKSTYDYILSGRIPPNPSELLQSSKMHMILDELAKTYDYVICDAPPVGIVTDAAVLSQACDGVILVIRQNYATKDQVNDAVQKLESVDAQIIGSILNQYDVSKDSKRKNSNYKYKYYYGD